MTGPNELPSYLLPRPAMPTDTATLASFEGLWREGRGLGGGALDYRLTAPRWQFLSWLSDTQDVLLHGSSSPDIAEFEPRKSNDVAEFGDRKAVYAASDALWAMYFAILDRNVPMTKINGATRLEMADGTLSEPYYFFSITDTAREQNAFAPGTMYIVPRTSFEQQPPMRFGGRTVHVAQWASAVHVRPLARLSIVPEDFPLLDEIRGHDDETTFAKARANPGGFPWVD